MSARASSCPTGLAAGIGGAVALASAGATGGGRGGGAEGEDGSGGGSGSGGGGLLVMGADAVEALLFLAARCKVDICWGGERRMLICMCVYERMPAGVLVLTHVCMCNCVCVCGHRNLGAWVCVHRWQLSTRYIKRQAMGLFPRVLYCASILQSFLKGLHCASVHQSFLCTCGSLADAYALIYMFTCALPQCASLLLRQLRLRLRLLMLLLLLRRRRLLLLLMGLRLRLLHACVHACMRVRAHMPLHMRLRPLHMRRTRSAWMKRLPSAAGCWTWWGARPRSAQRRWRARWQRCSSNSSSSSSSIWGVAGKALD